MEGPKGSNVCQQILPPSQVLPSIKIQIDSSTILPIVEPHQILSKICTNGDASVASDKIFDEIDELKYEIKSRAGTAVVVANNRPTKSRRSALLSKILNFHRNPARSVSKSKYCQTPEMSSPEHHLRPAERAFMDLDTASDLFVEDYQETRQISARPYHWPHDRSFHRTTTALVIIDMQKDFASDKGYLKNQGIDNQPILDIVPNIRKLLDACRAKGFTVYHTREGHRSDLSTLSKREHFRSRNNGNRLGIGDPGPLGRLLIRGEEGHEIIDELAPRPNEQIIDKPGRSAFQHTEFQLMLSVKGIRNLIFCGVTTDVCVMSTMREANDNNFDCVLVEDACAAGVYEHHKSAVESITEEGGIFGAVTTVEDVLAKMDRLLEVIEPESVTSHPIPAETNADDESKTAHSNSAGVDRSKPVPGTVIGENRPSAGKQFSQMSLAEPAPEVGDYIDDGTYRRKSTQGISDQSKPPVRTRKVSASQRMGMAYPHEGNGENSVARRMDVSDNEENTMPTIMHNGKRLENLK
ncbi:3b531868-b625-4a5f-b621-80b84dcc0b88 [Sclerotinia trifoliorum]|uniref:3b531868-b625-4a5f-b621-80b84dcc0b88 n=1 Tax=Sclerotinia trifoliorum TaxID=28548 RepID=A0A8H2ZRV6_9HELO|nr:3b531868-b625-4a5f-b621-80b84dcc0b88 [Sclerotinia trifoliorum]